MCREFVACKQRWAPALFSRFHAHEREAKKRARKREEKRARKKAKAPSAKEKSANSRFFLNQQWKSGFRAQAARQGGKARVLSEMLNVKLKKTNFTKELNN